MEPNEIDLQPAAPGLGAVRRDARKHIELTPNEKLILAQWYGTPAYEVFLKLAEAEIEKAETRHFQAWQSTEMFNRFGVIAVAMRIFFERIQAEANFQMQEFSGEVAYALQEEDAFHTSPEELIQRQFTS